MSRGWRSRWDGCNVVVCTPLLPRGLLALFRGQQPWFPLFGLDPLLSFIAFREYVVHLYFNFAPFLGLGLFCFYRERVGDVACACRS